MVLASAVFLILMAGGLFGVHFGDRAAVVQWTVAAGLGVLVLDGLAIGIGLSGYAPKRYERRAEMLVSVTARRVLPIVAAVLWGISYGSVRDPGGALWPIAIVLATVLLVLALTMLVTCLSDEKDPGGAKDPASAP